uniref:glutaminase n=1 Tax=Ditylenchus dipsaci TaxID=166011 RepID=A0A915EFE4_9BILA
MVIGMPLVVSNSPNAALSLQQYSPLLEERKGSIQKALLKTKEGLANPFACDELSAEELIYNLFKIPNKSEASIGKLLMVLKNYGLLETDPRLQPMMHKIREIEQEKEDRVHESKDPRHWKMNKEDFKKCIGESLSLISQTLQNDLIVPSWGQFTQIIKEIYSHCKAITVGKVADYIPQLARFSPDQFGVSICTVDGQRISFGDAKTPFACKEPSGRLFNEICLDSNHKPHNPMVNSGAIIVTSLIQHKSNMADRFDYVLTQYRKISGGEYVGFNNAVFLSERSTADRNFALAYYMKENNCFPEDTSSLTEALDFYFQLCSLEVTCESASVMAATLANGGVCPITGERCIGSRPCRDVLSLMNSCGMYDYSGQFAFHVGLPAKSGVSGLLIVVVPNVLGLALWSPPLDKLGNSCRGVAFCKELVSRFNFHNYDSLAHNESRKFDPRRRVGDREKDQVVSLLFAAKAGDLNTVRRMYMQGFDLEMADYDKRTALHLAASEGHYDVASFLINTAKVKMDRAPLQDAKAQNHHSVVNLLEKATVSQLSVAENYEEESAAREYSNEVVQKPVLFSQHSVPSSLYSRPYTLLNNGSTAAKRAIAIKKSMSVASVLSYASSIPSSSSSDEEGIIVKSLSPKLHPIEPVKEDEGDKTLSDDSAYNSPAVRQFSSTSSNPMISPVTATAPSPLISPVRHARNGSNSNVGRQRVVPNDSHRQLNGLRNGVKREKMYLTGINRVQMNGGRAGLEVENGLNELDDVENDSDVASLTKENISIGQKD